MEVEYSSTLPKVESIRRYPADHPSAGHLQIDVRKEAKAFTTKSQEWQYEEELRVFKILENPASGGELAKCPGDLTGILFGLRTPRDKVVSIDRLLKGSPDVVFKSARFRGDSYQLDLVPIDRSRIHSEVDS